MVLCLMCDINVMWDFPSHSCVRKLRTFRIEVQLIKNAAISLEMTVVMKQLTSTCGLIAAYFKGKYCLMQEIKFYFLLPQFVVAT